MKKLSLLLSAALLCSTAFAQIDLKKGLMLYLPFNGNTMDASPNANHGINFGATLTTDQWGNMNSAYFFDGKTNYMRVPNHPTLQIDSAVTLCARVNVKGYYNGYCYGNNIVQKGQDDLSGNYVLRFSPTNNASDCGVQDTNNNNYYGGIYTSWPSLTAMNNAPYVKTNKWDCLVYSYDGDTARMYVNGVLRHKKLITTLIGKNTLDLFLGKQNNATYPFWFNGIMDEIRVYNRALNMLEIDSLCNISNPQGSAINEIKLNESLPFANNPVGDELLLNLTAKQMGGDLTIVDMTGKTVLKMSALQTNKIALEGIASGMYIVNYLLDNSYLRAKMMKK